MNVSNVIWCLLQPPTRQADPSACRPEPSRRNFDRGRRRPLHEHVRLADGSPFRMARLASNPHSLISNP